MIKSPAEGVLKDTLQRIADAILDGTGADISVVCLRSEDGTYRIEAYAGDFPVALKDDLDFKAGQGSAGGVVAETGEPRLIRDYLREMKDSPFMETAKKVGVRSIVNAAAGPAGDVIAVLYVMNRTPDTLSETDRDRLAAQAKIADIAIRNAI